MSNKNTVSDSDIKHIAHLARLSVTDEEVALYAKQLSDVLDSFAQLDEVDVEGVEPTFQMLDDTTNVWREDEIKPSLTQDEALSNAEHAHEGYFVVDRLIAD